MKFESPQTKDTLGPFYLENDLSDIPIFGPERGHVASIAHTILEARTTEQHVSVDEVASSVPLPDTIAQATSLAEKLRALRKYIWGITHPDHDEDEFETLDHATMLARLEIGDPDEVGTLSSRSLHEALIRTTMETAGFPKPAQLVLDHIMLFRAKESYLLDCRANCNIVDDDPWLKAVWGWIKGTLIIASSESVLTLTHRQMRKRLVKMVACELIQWILAIWA